VRFATPCRSSPPCRIPGATVTDGCRRTRSFVTSSKRWLAPAFEIVGSRGLVVIRTDR
jgi:hypothetical protein